MILRTLGAVILCLGSTCLGFSAAGSVRKSARTLQQLKRSLEMMRCEVSYTLTPAAKICEILCAGSEGEVRRFYRRLAEIYKGSYPTKEDWARELTASTLHSLPQQTADAMAELVSSFGRFGAEEQLRLIDVTLRKTEDELLRLDSQKQQRCKCYEMLGICTGLAAAILVL